MTTPMIAVSLFCSAAVCSAMALILVDWFLPRHEASSANVGKTSDDALAVENGLSGEPVAV